MCNTGMVSGEGKCVSKNPLAEADLRNTEKFFF